MNDPTPLDEQLSRLCAGFPGTAGVAARNLSTGEEAAVNERVSFPTASMIKILVLFELVRQCVRGQAQMRGIMRIQKHTSFLLAWHLPFNPYAFEFGEAQDIWVAAKSGGLTGVRCESGIIHTSRADWALAVMTKSFSDGRWTHDNLGS